MVRLRVHKLMAERGITAYALSRGAGLPYPTAYRLSRSGGRFGRRAALSPSGIFDRATSTKLLAARGSALPAAGADTAPPPTDTTRQTRTPTTDSRAWHGFILAMKSLFTPPVIGMVTSLLLFGITYVALKIRRTSLRRSD